MATSAEPGATLNIVNRLFVRETDKQVFNAFSHTNVHRDGHTQDVRGVHARPGAQEINTITLVSSVLE